MKNILDDIKYLGIIRTIKFGFQRMFFGYSDDLYWEFDTYFSQFIPPIKKFCNEELANLKLMELNPKRREVFLEMIKHITAWEKRDVWNDKETPLLWEYFGKNILYFWN